MVREHRAEHASQWAAIVSIAAKIGCTAQTLNEWMKKADVDSGRKPGLTSNYRERRNVLKCENRELRQANEIRARSRVFCASGARPPMEAMIRFVDAYRDAGEPICKVLPIAPSTYHAHAARARPIQSRHRPRVRRDTVLVRRDPQGFRRELPGLRRAQGLAAARTRWLRRRPLGCHGRISPPGNMGVIRRRGDPKGLCDRLDPEPVPIRVDEADHFGAWRSSSAPKKCAAPSGSRSPGATHGSHARAPASGRAPRSSTPPAGPLVSASSPTVQRLAVQPILPAIDTIASHCDRYSSR